MERKREYCDYIENSDFKGLAKLFEELSKEELKTMLAIYTDLDKKGLIIGNLMTDDQKVRLIKKERYNK